MILTQKNLQRLAAGFFVSPAQPLLYNVFAQRGKQGGLTNRLCLPMVASPLRFPRNNAREEN
jgi:hypothetical protein